MVRDAELGRRYADKLAEVYTLDGAETWVLAQLQALTHRSGSARKFAKLRLIRFLYQRDYTREQILAWFRVLDWMLRLPEDLEKEFMDELTAFEEQQNMPYVTSAERVGIQKGLQQGLEQGRQEGRKEGEAAILLRQIALKFGPPTEDVRARIEAADADTLLAWSTRILTAERVDDIFR